MNSKRNLFENRDLEQPQEEDSEIVVTPAANLRDYLKGLNEVDIESPKRVLIEYYENNLSMFAEPLDYIVLLLGNAILQPDDSPVLGWIVPNVDSICEFLGCSMSDLRELFMVDRSFSSEFFNNLLQSLKWEGYFEYVLKWLYPVLDKRDSCCDVGLLELFLGIYKRLQYGEIKLSIWVHFFVFLWEESVLCNAHIQRTLLMLNEQNYVPASRFIFAKDKATRMKLANRFEVDANIMRTIIRHGQKDVFLNVLEVANTSLTDNENVLGQLLVFSCEVTECMPIYNELKKMYLKVVSLKGPVLVLPQIYESMMNKAAINGSVNIMEDLIESYRMDLCRPDEWTALDWCCHHGVVESIKLLLDKLVMRSGAQQQPMHIAASAGHVQAIELLHQKYSDMVTQPSLSRALPLHNAAMSGRLEAVKFLMTLHPEAAMVRDKNGCTPLHHSARYGYIDISLHLIQSMDDLCSVDGQGLTPLSRAAENCHTILVEDVLDMYPDAPISLIHAVNANAHEIVKILAKKRLISSDAVRELIAATKNGNVEIVSILIECGVDVNVIVDGWTPLMHAVRSCQLHSIRTLTSYGANPTHGCLKELVPNEGVIATDGKSPIAALVDSEIAKWPPTLTDIVSWKVKSMRYDLDEEVVVGCISGYLWETTFKGWGSKVFENPESVDFGLGALRLDDNRNSYLTITGSETTTPYLESSPIRRKTRSGRRRRPKGRSSTGQTQSTIETPETGECKQQ